MAIRHTRSHTLSVRVTPHERLALERRAAQGSRTVSDLVRRILQDRLQSNDQAGSDVLAELFAAAVRAWQPADGGSEERGLSEPRVRMVGFQCSGEDYDELTRAAEEDEMPTSDWLRARMREALARRVN